MTVQQFRREAQQAVDELYGEGRLPFSLTAHRVTGSDIADYYAVYFFDARLFSVTVNWLPGESFKVLVRDAVLKKIQAGL